MIESEPAAPPPRFLLTVRKWDVVDVLRRQHSLQTMVQVLTPSTGPDMHGRPELAHFGAATTLTYVTDRHRRELPDASALPNLDQLLTWCADNRLEADLVFIDCWHSYEDSLRLLELAWSILPRGGFIVMHDCDPPDAEAAGPPPESLTTLWCGESWRAFVDFTASLPPGCDWFVVESDLGVGVIDVRSSRKRRGRARKRLSIQRQAPAGYEDGWNWLVAHRQDVLRPMSIATWQRRAADESPQYNR